MLQALVRTVVEEETGTGKLSCPSTPPWLFFALVRSSAQLKETRVATVACHRTITFSDEAYYLILYSVLLYISSSFSLPKVSFYTINSINPLLLLIMLGILGNVLMEFLFLSLQMRRNLTIHILKHFFKWRFGTTFGLFHGL